ncbi:transposase family protein [Streptomyces sp. NPDC056352]|uniref:helix-turn-helix domain-containing protein n=1 Tax=Streptomyces sp. NPDC056352 TaxID=3345791 RepID=UPI0035DD82DE
MHLRHQLPHEVLAELYGVDRSTVSTAIRQVRPLLAARGFAVPDRPGVRLRTLEDVFAYAEAEDVELPFDGAETQVRRPRAGRPGRRAFVSGKCRQNTIKTTTFSDGQGRMLLSGVVRPGRMHEDGPAHRRLRRTAPTPPLGDVPGRRRVRGAGQGVPPPGHRPAQEAEERRVRR